MPGSSWRRYRALISAYFVIARSNLRLNSHIAARIGAACARFLLVIARTQVGISRRDRRLDGLPFPAAVAVFGRAGLQAAHVGVRAPIADVLLAVGLRKEQPQADA